VTEPVRVDVGACRCPGAPHPDGDAVFLHATATISIGAAAHMAVGQWGDDPMLLQVGLTRAFLLFGIASWTFTDEKGASVPVDPTGADWNATIDRLLPFNAGGYEVAERCDALYAGDVLRPLMARLPKRSPDGLTAGSTSPIRASGRKPRTRRSLSLPTGTDGRLSVVPAP